MADGHALLELNDVRIRYGVIEAVKGINLTVNEGEIVTLIGGNGAGKTTTLRAISMVHGPSQGQIMFEGEDITSLKSHEVVEQGHHPGPRGAAHLPEHVASRENLDDGCLPANDGDQVRARTTSSITSTSCSRVLKERLKQAGGTLSGGEQQMLAIGRALMAKPKLLMLDEPSMGLAPQVVERVFEVIEEVNSQGDPRSADRAERTDGAPSGQPWLRHRDGRDRPRGRCQEAAWATTRCARRTSARNREERCIRKNRALLATDRRCSRHSRWSWPPVAATRANADGARR